jgi:hypothetical protein
MIKRRIMKQMEIVMPDKEGEYLFYFGHAEKPFYAVDTLHFVIDENGDETCDIYLENHNQREISGWWGLPIQNCPLSTSERHWI